jgi:predicted acylesterase/phospholipase RssA/Mrp family chromosome partitioning ATPase
MSDAAPLLSSPKGVVITFYSYKGGTGRTMALANTACLLAGEGRDGGQAAARVLMVDWDLEAPGLHRFFRGALVGGMSVQSAEVDRELDAKPGLIDLFTVLQDEVYGATSADGMQSQDAADQMLAGIPISEYVLHTDNPYLDLLKAGAQNDTYAARISTFDWADLFKRSPWIYRAFADRLAREYDYVLIDSRTGESDTTGICTRMLPEKLVVVFTPNRQSLTGVEKLARRAVAYRKESEDPRPLAIFPLPSRVDSTYPTFVENWRDGNPSLDLEGYRFHFERLLKELYGFEHCDLSEYFREVELQYIPEYSFGEEIAVRRERGSSRLSFAKSYETFVCWLRDRSGPWEKRAIVEARERREEERRRKRTRIDDAFAKLDSADRVTARRLLTRLVRVSYGETAIAGQPVDLRQIDPDTVATAERLEHVGLITIDPANERGVRRLRIANEAALQWGQLREWTEADREFLLWRQELDESLARWEARGRPQDRLLSAALADKAAEWLSQRSVDLDERELDFIQASLASSRTAGPSAADSLARAQAVLRGVNADIAEIEDLAKAMKGVQEFGYARRLFARARRHEAYAGLPADKKRFLGQQHALCTYKDADLTAARFSRALEILGEVDPPESSTDPETLGIAGAIHKRLWEVEGQRAALERSLGFYRRGRSLGTRRDLGYNGVNAAFVGDLLAREVAREAAGTGSRSSAAAALRDEARTIREQLVRELPALLDGPEGGDLSGQWWFCATVAEANFGLARYDEAVSWLRKGPPIDKLPPWEFQSTLQQLGVLVQVQRDLSELMPYYRGGPAPDADRAQAALRSFLGNAAPGVERFVAGKLGLALSGGGFRASLFHIGVLACLAERDALRHVEAMSCVSGGSIVGAHYYLEIQRLLSTKKDPNITQADYVDVVQRLIDDFLAGVQTNIRARLLSELWTQLKAMFWPAYTRTQRLGELYESRIFSRVKDGRGDSARWMDDLKITPLDEPPGFRPKYHNWRRSNKVPTLVLNATTLNTGHNWQFTATWMGEPPAGIDAEIDANYRLRRMYYTEAPARFKRFRLGHAVAASSCVPGILEPLKLRGLYPDRTIGLVDGGVFDNQGVASLLEQDCTLIMVSDASGQMSAENDPSSGVLGVPLRSFSISMARGRGAEYRELEARRRSASLRGLMFLHLKKGLDGENIDWVDCDDPTDASDDARPVDQRGVLTRFGIRKDVQTLLAGIRTDLDSFSDIEAYALMTSGYRMAQFEFRRSIEHEFPAAPRASVSWKFLDAESLLGQGPHFEQVKRHLSVGSKSAFKVWRMSTALEVCGVCVLAALFAAVCVAWWRWRNVTLVSVGSLGETVFGLLAALVIGSTLVRLIRFRHTLGQIGLLTTATLFAALAFKAHRLVFDPLFLRGGRLARFRKSKASRAPNASHSGTATD